MQPTPHPIEIKSYGLLEADLNALYPDVLTYPPLMRAVVKRVVHSTGDITLAPDLVMNEADLEAAVVAIKAKCPIVTDVQMTTSGIGGLSGFSKDNPVIGAITLGARPPAGQTRSYAGMMRAFDHIRNRTGFATPADTTVDATDAADAVDAVDVDAVVEAVASTVPVTPQPYIVVVGCSPTSVFALIDAVHNGMHPPVLCIGTPVGYVDARESKLQLRASGIPSITNQSMRGGAAVAAAMFNALRYHPRHPGDEN